MSAVFADTFYWIALADSADNAHRRALELTSEFANQSIVTTDEVLVEYLTFFATAHERMRRKALTNGQRILEAPVSMWSPRAGVRYFPAWLFMKCDPIRATA